MLDLTLRSHKNLRVFLTDFYVFIVIFHHSSKNINHKSLSIHHKIKLHTTKFIIFALDSKNKIKVDDEL